jgi:predicted esterase
VQLFEAGGIAPEKLLLLGFSQGACLTLEYAARHARRYGGIAGLSGGLIGPPDTPRDYAGSFAGTPVFLGCSDIDPHIPKERVVETMQVMERMGATVTMRLYQRMGHTVNMDELSMVRDMLSSL